MAQKISNNYNSKYRLSILNALLKSGLILSSAALLPSMAVSIIHQKYYIGIINIFFAFIFISLEYLKKLNYITKSVIILLIIYITGINVLFNYGFISGAPYWFFSAAIAAAVLLGLKAALISVITTSITLLTAALLFINTSVGDNLPFFLSKTHAFAALGNYILLNGTLSATVAVLLKKLETNEYRYRNITEKIDEIILSVNSKSEITFINNAVSILSEKPHKYFKGRNISELINSEILLKKISGFQNDSSISIHFEIEHIDCRGEKIILDISLFKSDEKKSGSITGIIRDITEKIQIRTKNERRSRMETVGNMAGSVAHELNNLLTGVVGYPDLILMEMDKKNAFYNYIREIQSSGEKAADIVQDLLIMSKKGLFQSESFSINREILSYTKSRDFLLSKKRKADSVLEIDLSQENPGIFCSLIHFKKSLSNMIQNAFDFIESDGIIKIKTEIVSISEPYSTRFTAIPPGSYVCLSVIDNGHGIREEDIEHVFEPFYTKKVMKINSTGLGMAVVWGTAAECGAFPDISSIPDKETSVQIYFPAVSIINTESEDAESSGTVKGNNKKILIVDDMPQQRKLCSEILNKLNYNTATAESGEKAVELIKSSSFDLVILDMIMDPGMDGLDTYNQISKIVPDQKTAVLSGYSESDRLKILTENHKIPYLKKPYTITQLAELTAEALRSKAGS